MSILVAVGRLVVSITAAFSRRPEPAQQNLGWVSERWLAEHRTGEMRPSG